MFFCFDFFSDAYESLIGPYLLPQTSKPSTIINAAEDDFSNCVDCIFVMRSYIFEEDSVLSKLHVDVADVGYFKVFVCRS